LVAQYAHLDKGGMLSRVLSYPEDLERGVNSYADLRLEISVPHPLEGVVVAGMGGSFIGALFLQDLLGDRWQTSIHAIRDMSLPAYVNSNYLVIAVSYSGNTEEIIRVLAEALRRGAPVIAVASGGLMAKYSERLRYPLVRLPPGLAPRAAFPYIISALSAILDQIDPSLNLLKSIEDSSRALMAARERLIGESLELSEWMIANYSSRFLVVYAYRPYVSAGYRLKTQINENAKLHAFFSELPEANHNEIMGWESPSNVFTLAIRARSEPPEVLHRMEFLLDLWRSRGIEFREVVAEGDGRAQELLRLFFKFDLASVLLALKRGVDPTPVETISQLKRHLDARINVEDILSRLQARSR